MAEQPYMRIHPICPKCGQSCVWVGESDAMVNSPDDVFKVRCPECGWEGESVISIPIPTPHG